MRIKVLKTKTVLLDGKRVVCSESRDDHTNRMLAWCDSNRTTVANDPRVESLRGTWRMVGGQVVR